MVLGNGLAVVLDGKGDDVGIPRAGGDGQLHQKGVLDVAEPAAPGGVQLDAQRVRLPLAQRTGRKVGQEVQPVDLEQDPGQGRGGDLAGIVQDVADGLPGDLGGESDVNQRGPLGSFAPCGHPVLSGWADPLDLNVQPRRRMLHR